MPLMSQRAYARHRGVHVHAVQRALAAGRIRAEEGSGQIDSDTADAEWARNTRPAMHTEDVDASLTDQFLKARAVKEHYQARLSKLDFEQRSGQLVSVSEVKLAAFDLSRRVRDHMLNLPDRLAAILAAESDAAKCYEILASEIRKALNEFADAHN